MGAINPAVNREGDFMAEVGKESGENPLLCYQCGNCTAGCPYTEFFDYPVHRIMRLIQVGQRETVLTSKAIWLCASCETCTTRCPCEIDVAHIMDTLRAMSLREGKCAEKDVRTFYDAFLASLQRHGRIYELGILMRYNLLSRHVFADADLGPKVMAKGLIRFLPTNIKGRDEVAGIFRKYAEKRK
jgi:heterodisulfide reductase subunit C